MKLLPILFLLSCSPNSIITEIKESVDYTKGTMNWDTQVYPNCWVKAALNLITMRYAIDTGNAPPHLSEQFIHNQFNVNTANSGDAHYFYLTFKTGIPYSNAFPFGVKQRLQDANPKSVYEMFYFDYKTSPYQAHYGYFIEDLIKALNAIGPIALNIHSNPPSVIDLADNIFPCSDRYNPSNHVVLIVGYKEYGKILLVQDPNYKQTLELTVPEHNYCGFSPSITYLQPNSITKKTLTLSDLKTEFINRDLDLDSINDWEDNCPVHPNPDQLDTNDDLIGDACD